MSELNQKEVNEQMYLFVKRWLDDLPFEEIKKVPVMAIGYCLARLSKQDELLKEQKANKPSAGEIAEEMVNYICEHEKVVRCKDCKFAELCEIAYRFGEKDDWFCADGERK